MSKICPKCRRKQDNPAYLGCEICKVSFVDESELVTSFTKDELKIIASYLLKDWRVYVAAAIGLLVGIGLLYWQIHDQIKTQIRAFQVTASNQVVTAYSDATNQLAAKFQIFAQDASNQISLAYGSVTNEIAIEFQTPRIKQIVADVASTQASNLLVEQIQPEIENFRMATSNTLAKFDESLTKFQKDSTNALSDIRTATDFTLIIAKAQNDDASAFSQLLQFSTSTNTTLGAVASDTIAAITKRAETDVLTIDNTTTLKWPLYGIDPDKASLQQLEDFYKSQSNDSTARFQTVKQIYNCTRFSEKKRFLFVAQTALTDNSIKIRQLCCNLMDKKANMNLDFPGALR